jgi:ankyrin repeat protein
MTSSRLRKSLCLRDSILTKSTNGYRRSRSTRHTASAEDIIFIHILDCMGALSCIRADQKKTNNNSYANREEGQAEALISCKHRVFWQAVREIADHEAALEDVAADNKKKEKSSALDFMLACFPDEMKPSDGRLWLPLHLAVSVPSSRLEDIHTLFTANPAAIKAPADETTQLNPCHLAAMMKKPRMEMIQRLQIYYPDFGSSLDSDLNTPLHLAARYSDSDAMVRELAQLHPAALELKNGDGDTPLHLAARYSDSAAMVRELAQLYPAALVTMNRRGETPLADIINLDSSPEFDVTLRVLLEAAPQAARIACSSLDNDLPLHIILNRKFIGTKEQLAMVLAAYREAVNIPNMHGYLPIHYAAKFASADVMKMIAEENMSNMSAISSIEGSVAHFAVQRCSLEHLQYIQSVMPEQLLSVDRRDQTPLHYLKYMDEVQLSSPLSAASDVLRFLLRHCPGLAATQDDDGDTLYDYLSAEDVGLAYARRLLLLAGASSLYPGVLQEMNYAARREALLLFHSSSSSSSATKPSIFSRIRNGAGGPELMRTIVGFL